MHEGRIVKGFPRSEADEETLLASIQGATNRSKKDEVFIPNVELDAMRGGNGHGGH
jgi:hypothetical protein